MADPPMETSPPQKTLFARDIQLAFTRESAEGGPETAVYVPPGVDVKSDKLNVVLWLHGHKSPGMGLQKYFADPRFTFREILLRRAAAPISATPDGTSTVRVAPNVVLVAPKLGSADDDAGSLATDAEAYMGQVKQRMATHLGFPGGLSWSQMVIACHSGGGKPAKQIAGQMAAMMQKGGGKLAEVWHFDSLYENETQTKDNPEPTARWWVTFAGFWPATKIKVFHLTTTAHSEYLAKNAAAEGRANVFVEPSADSVHDTVARTHFPGCYDAWLASMGKP